MHSRMASLRPLARDRLNQALMLKNGFNNQNANINYLRSLWRLSSSLQSTSNNQQQLQQPLLLQNHRRHPTISTAMFHSTRLVFEEATAAASTEETSPNKEEEGEATGGGEEVSMSDIQWAFTPAPPLSEKSKKRVDDIFEQILYLDMVEIHLLTQVISEKLGYSGNIAGGDAGMMVDGAAAAGGAAEEAAPEKTLFEVKLVGFDAKAKIKVIKEIRAISGLGLKEAKELVESAPKVVQKDLKQDKADELKAQLEAAGAQVEIV